MSTAATIDEQLLQFQKQSRFLRDEVRQAAARKPFDKSKVSELLARLRSLDREHQN